MWGQKERNEKEWTSLERYPTTFEKKTVGRGGEGKRKKQKQRRRKEEREGVSSTIRRRKAQTRSRT